MEERCTNGVGVVRLGTGMGVVVLVIVDTPLL